MIWRLIHCFATKFELYFTDDGFSYTIEFPDEVGGNILKGSLQSVFNFNSLDKHNLLHHFICFWNFLNTLYLYCSTNHISDPEQRSFSWSQIWIILFDFLTNSYKVWLCGSGNFVSRISELMLQLHYEIRIVLQSMLEQEKCLI